ncbi:hypothetical protein Sa4125_12310 [Aureimonas sp. SA4125]|uniref:head-tail connector protein n=1 Tax=Aureimonas sp. SA4125 TaxID=2826993 RepID=UPI001CC70B06|nr:head-tail connector protein [Aureimonas sp. SA4125]BDA83689.1 hypothetical protein Sa4125_12310 [Aureimonas sp. SA4125]
MTLIDLGGIAAEPVTLAEAKAWCRIERDDEDALLARLVAAARETVERETRLVLVRRGFRLALDPVPGDGWIEITRHPLHEVTSVVAFDGAGVPTEFGPGQGVIERALGVEAIRVSQAVVRAAVNGAEIEFTSGFAPGTVPENLVLAMQRIVATAYELRGAVSAGMQPAIVPDAARVLIAPFRRVLL